ncbi:MAG: glucose-6-phosphate isomerase [Pseudomonadota bacterium]
MGNSSLTDFLAPLIELRGRLGATSISQLFDQDQERFVKFSIRLGDLLFDYSKNRIDDDTFDKLVEMASSVGIEAKRDAMFSGEKINRSEDRAVLHTALRKGSAEPLMLDGKDVMPEVREILGRALEFAEQVRTGDYKVSGNRVTDVVNLGIGGSDLGPRTAVEALAPFADGPRIHFVANVDGADLSDKLSLLDPATTLFIVASKSFTTLETMTNARSALAWVKSSIGEQATDHFVALSSNPQAAAAFGIPQERTFGFWDWVGGRYSVWSAIGLSVMIAVGREQFEQFLSGANEADQHFSSAPLKKNIPVIMALVGIWHRNICGYSNFAVLPYDNRMASFPRWMQQLDMESNGKSVNQNGQQVMLDTGPVVFGEPGTNGQHAFYQLLHQGTEIIPCDFLVAVNGHEPEFDYHHQQLLANCLAQSEAMMRGRSLSEAGGNVNRVIEGNRPSNTFLYKQLDPKTLGLLMALYEHKVFVQGTLWGINSFDQWGVELGKELAGPVLEAIASSDGRAIENASTRALLNEISKMRG